MISPVAWLALWNTALVSAAPRRGVPAAYAPVTVECPATDVVRPAHDVSSAEARYVAGRHHKASHALRAWLERVDACFAADESDHEGAGEGADGQRARHHRAPVIALTSSGGGYRAQLSGAGVVKAFDARETGPSTGVRGLYQAVTYHAGLSGGSWLLSSIAGNDFPTISSLQAKLWEPTLQDSVIVPEILLSPQAQPIYAAVRADVKAKAAAGFTPSIIDPWGRLLSHGLLYGADGGVSDTLHGIASGSSFAAHDAPYPIITALGSDNNISGTCIPQPNATQYEFHPYEFGSWDAGVGAFVDARYLGTRFSGGRPAGPCVTRYDQLGYVLGTSSNVFGSACSPIPANMSESSSQLSLAENLASLTAPGAPGVPEIEIFGLYPNPFQDLPSSPHVASQETLELVDGGVGVTFQGNPIWPFLHRDVDVILVNDNSADSLANYPNGSEVRHTYEAARAAGLTRMPFVPTADVFVAQGLNVKPTFFGCHDDSQVTLVFLPNHNYTYDSGQPTTKIQYAVNETRAMIDNGVHVANYGGKQDWPLCLACGIMKKSKTPLPDGCATCFEEYCYN